jgi:hypothetical protein
MINPRGGDFYLATTGDHNLAVDKMGHCRAVRLLHLAAALLRCH